MALHARIRFLKGVDDGEEARGVITLSVTLPDGSERPADAHTARFAPSAPSIDVTLLLDTSGSMSPFQHMLRVSTATLVRLLPVPLSHVRVITFDNQATERKARTHLSSAEVQTELVAWSASLAVTSGSTNMYSALSKLKPSDAQQFVLLLSDGHANTGKTGHVALCSTAAVSLGDADTRPPVLFSCIGFNEPANLQMPLLNGLAALTDGTVHIVQTEDKVHEAFGDIVGDMVSVLAGNVRLLRSESAHVNSRFLTHEKLKGIHVRLGAPRHIPFKVSSNGSATFSFWDVLNQKEDTVTVDIVVPPKEQAVDWDVHEALLFTSAAELVDEFDTAKKRLRLHLSMLGACPRASFMSPIPFSPGTGAGGALHSSGSGAGMHFSGPGVFTQSFTTDPEDEDNNDGSAPPPKRIRAIPTILHDMQESMTRAWHDARASMLDEDWEPIKNKLRLLLADVEINPNKSGKRLQGLAHELQKLLATEVDTDESVDARATNLGFDLVHQRSGVRDTITPLGALDFDLTASQMASRMVSRTLSSRPDVSASSAADMLHDTLAIEPSADDTEEE